MMPFTKESRHGRMRACRGVEVFTEKSSMTIIRQQMTAGLQDQRIHRSGPEERAV